MIDSLVDKAPRHVLVIANAYPSDDELYRNGFIHRRVKAYQQADIDVDVFYEHAPARVSREYEFDGVRVRVGGPGHLRDHALEQAYDAILVHFAEPRRIDPLVQAGVTCPVIVWVHGFEAEAWHRRWFNYIDDAASVRAILAKKNTYYAGQMAFFRELMTTSELDLTFVNVSEWFQRYVVEPDVGVGFDPTRSVVIPNLVDEEFFPHVPKQDVDRFKILSIRPFASRKYANDMTVKAILELSERPFFDRLQFTIVGEGALFDEVTEPIRQLSNVDLRNAFLSQTEIVELHRQHGVFLAPTRFDSQGVSVCEAMSSGLVGISTDVAAVPEFIQDRVTGMLAAPESATALADALEELYFDPELFQSVSAAGAARMRAQCGRRATVEREIELISQKVACHE